MPKPESFGYGFSEASYSGPVALHWTVTAELWLIDRSGAALQEVGHEQLVIGRLSAAHQPHIELTPPAGRRGFYRFDMQIANRAGKVLGKYSTYFKVVRPFWRIKLGLRRKTVRPGQRVLSRLENYGSETAAYGESFSVQRFEGGRWVGVPELLPGGWLDWLGELSPGATGRCNAVDLPPDTSPGRYRIVKNVGPAPWPKGKKSVNVTAPFRVVGHAESALRSRSTFASLGLSLSTF